MFMYPMSDPMRIIRHAKAIALLDDEWMINKDWKLVKQATRCAVERIEDIEAAMYSNLTDNLEGYKELFAAAYEAATLALVARRMLRYQRRQQQQQQWGGAEGC